MVASKLLIDFFKVRFLMEKSDIWFIHRPVPKLPISRNFMF